MQKRTKKLYYLVSISCILIIGIVYFFIFIKKDSWVTTLDNTGSSSSARCVELTGDGILDIVVGGGGKENNSSKNGVLALNGATGEIIWKIPSRNQVVGSPIFYDINNDNIKDVFIGGRSSQLWCINGSDGKIIWEYLSNVENLKPKDTTLLNFFNPQLITDLDNDNYKDILISFGGYVPAASNEMNRPQGKIIILSSKTGKILSQKNMPDKKETYLSPVVFDFNNDKDSYVIYGSGGETINGGLYIEKLSSLMGSTKRNPKKLADGDRKGFMSPPIITDITEDNIADIIISSYNGKMMAFNGKTFDLIWEKKIGYRTVNYASIAPIDVNNDGIMDFFSTYSVGIWPVFSKSIQVLIDGKTGKELKRYNIGFFNYASPLVADFTKDGKDDILLSINNINTKSKNINIIKDSITKRIYTSKLMILDLHNDKFYDLGKEKFGSNLGSTPLITDLDFDGNMDIIECINEDKFDFFSFNKLIISRKEINLDPSSIKWGSYMGTNYDGIY